MEHTDADKTYNYIYETDSLLIKQEVSETLTKGDTENSDICNTDQLNNFEGDSLNKTEEADEIEIPEDENCQLTGSPEAQGFFTGITNAENLSMGHGNIEIAINLGNNNGNLGDLSEEGQSMMEQVKDICENINKEVPFAMPGGSKQDSSKPYKCNVCDYSTNHRGSLKRHKTIHSEEKPYQCGICDFTTRYLGSMKQHQMRHSGEKPFKCEKCDFRSSSKRRLKRHEDSIHVSNKSYKCDLCDFFTTVQIEFTKHQMMHNGKEPYKCEWCNFTTTQKLYLRRHSVIHTGEKPFSCELCDFKTSLKSNLKIHMKMHSGIKPYKCDICDYRCRQLYHLKSHRMIHTGENPHKCEHCEYSTKSKACLRRHIARHHTDERKEYKCEYCDHVCYRTNHLQSHMEKHIRDRPFKCILCGFSTKWENFLLTHTCSTKALENGQPDEKPFECETCEYRTDKLSRLKLHESKHRQDKPYKCDLCEFTTNWAASLKSHKLLMHGLKVKFKSKID